MSADLGYGREIAMEHLATMRAMLGMPASKPADHFPGARKMPTPPPMAQEAIQDALDMQAPPALAPSAQNAPQARKTGPQPTSAFVRDVATEASIHARHKAALLADMGDTLAALESMLANPALAPQHADLRAALIEDMRAWLTEQELNEAERQAYAAKTQKQRDYATVIGTP